MAIPLPNLDDRRWADLVEEGRALIPFYAPEWTDHNIHDPGITLIELLAWIAEMDIYRLNRIPNRHRRKFLALVGVKPYPPRAAHTVLSFTLKKPGAPGPGQSLALPATVEFGGDDPFKQPTRFRTLRAVTIVPGELKAVKVKEKKGLQDVTGRWLTGENFGIFGTIPERGAELYLGFSEALPRNEPVSLFFFFAGTRSGEEEGRRLRREAAARKAACRPPLSDLCLKEEDCRGRKQEKPAKIPPHHSVRTVWEFLTTVRGEKKWQPLRPDYGEVDDDTRAFTLDGRVLVRIPADMAAERNGQAELYYLRCRFERGEYDVPPVLQNLAMNAVRAEQAVPVGIVTKFGKDESAGVVGRVISKGTVSTGPEPSPGDVRGLRLNFNSEGQISQLHFEDTDGDFPEFVVLDYRKASPAATGLLSIEAVALDPGTGEPSQPRYLPEAPVQECSFQLFTLENNEWHTWQLRSDFDVSTRTDPHFLLNPTDGLVTFGDGEKGRVPPLDASIFAVYRTTRAEAGNMDAGKISRLLDSPHNKALLHDFDGVKNQLASILNPVAAVGGTAAETLAHAEGRAVELMEKPQRAVTLSDYEKLAMETPGVQLARASARANLHPSFPCLKAPGLITVIILPNMPVPRPAPGPGLRRAVAAYLHRRRIIGTRVEVVGPTYLDVAVRVKVQALAGGNKSDLRRKIEDAINNFFHPIRGGPDKTGWPLGRDVYRSEVLQIIDEVPGVDHVLSLELIAEGCKPQCGNVCLSPTWLVAAGSHEIEVV